MVEAIANSVVLRVKQLQWQKVFHMFYIEPIVFILVFAHSFSGKTKLNKCEINLFLMLKDKNKDYFYSNNDDYSN